MKTIVGSSSLGSKSNEFWRINLKAFTPNSAIESFAPSQNLAKQYPSHLRICAEFRIHLDLIVNKLSKVENLKHE